MLAAYNDGDDPVGQWIDIPFELDAEEGRYSLVASMLRWRSTTMGEAPSIYRTLQH